VRLEAPHSVDDIVIQFADGHHEFQNVKLSVHVGAPRGQALGKVSRTSARLRVRSRRSAYICNRQAKATQMNFDTSKESWFRKHGR